MLFKELNVILFSPTSKYCNILTARKHEYMYEYVVHDFTYVLFLSLIELNAQTGTHTIKLI